MNKKAILGIMLTAFILSSFEIRSGGHQIKASPGSFIHILEDGTVWPEDAPIGRAGFIYFLICDLYDWEIICSASNVVIDGNKYTLTYPEPSAKRAIYLVPSIDNVVVKNFRIKGASTGIDLHESYGNTIIDNVISDTSFSIYLYESDYNTITGNVITESEYQGIRLLVSHGNTVTDNNVTSITSSSGLEYISGICLYESDYNTITHNVISQSNESGIYSSVSSYNTIIDNSVTKNAVGISLYESSNDNTINDNEISENSEHGINLLASSGNTISSNLISKNGNDGINMATSSDCTVTDNKILKNADVGICFPSSSDNTFHHNIVMCNRIQAMGYGVNMWDDGKEGNYWGNYNGTDSDENGIGDTPYIIDANNQDRFPLMRGIRISAPASLTSNYGWGTTQKGVFWPVNHEWIDRLGVIRISSIGYSGEVAIKGDTITYKDTVKHLYVAEPDKPFEPKLEISAFLQPGRSIDVPIFHGCKSKEPVPETCLFQIKVTTVEDCPKTYTAGIEIHWVGMDECANGYKIVTGMTAEFRTIVEGGSWTYLKSEAKLPPGWSYSVDPPNGTLFETPYMVTLRITAAQNAKEGDIGIVTLSAFSNETKSMFWRFIYFAAVDNTPPTIEAIHAHPWISTRDVTISVSVKDVVTGIDSVQLLYSVDDGPWKNETMHWYSGDTFNSTLFTLTVPSMPEGSMLRYYVVTTDWLRNQAKSEVQICITPTITHFYHWGLGKMVTIIEREGRRPIRIRN